MPRPSRPRRTRRCSASPRHGRALGLDRALTRRRVELDERYHAGIYGIPDEQTLDAMRPAARMEGVITDPVYEGKSMAGMVDLVAPERSRPRPPCCTPTSAASQRSTPTAPSSTDRGRRFDHLGHPGGSTTPGWTPLASCGELGGVTVATTRPDAARAAFDAARDRLVQQFATIPPGEPVRLAKRTSNLFRPRQGSSSPGLDVTGLDAVSPSTRSRAPPTCRA